jgi:hypothetical protein
LLLGCSSSLNILEINHLSDGLQIFSPTP